MIARDPRPDCATTARRAWAQARATFQSLDHDEVSSIS
jgi:hypothetical protein